MNRGLRAISKRVLAAALSMLFVLAACSSMAWAVDISAVSSLTVYAENTSSEEDSVGDVDLLPKDVYIDLYMLAMAKEVEGQDAYTFEFLSPFAGLTIGDARVDGFNFSNIVVSNDTWDDLAQQAASVVKEKGNEISPARRNEKLGEPISPLFGGLYLIVPHGTDSDYWKVNEDGSLATIARSAKNEYYISPSLISLPTKDAVDGESVVSTATPGDWVYDGKAYLKLEKQPMTGGVQITKSVDEYGGSPEKCVFRITAVDGDYTFSDVVAITINEETASGGSTAIVTGIQVGATVTVEEVYSGANYTFVSIYPDSTEPQTIVESGDADAPTYVAYYVTNHYNDTGRQGYGVQNHFTYTKTETSGQWACEKQ